MLLEGTCFISSREKKIKSLDSQSLVDVRVPPLTSKDPEFLQSVLRDSENYDCGLIHMSSELGYLATTPRSEQNAENCIRSMSEQITDARCCLVEENTRGQSKYLFYISTDSAESQPQNFTRQVNVKPLTVH